MPRRFIPTCVGNTSLLSINDFGIGGSSPRVWGILRNALSQRRAYRFIPTCVGNTIFPAPKDDLQAVHPHVCGEYVKHYAFLYRLVGSSPRVWGIPMKDAVIKLFLAVHPHVCGEYLVADEITGAFTRFIPTCVGNTFDNCKDWWDHSVHPHVCGEYVENHNFFYTSTRFIPTCVGNTIIHLVRVSASNGSSPRVWGILEVPCLAFNAYAGSSPRVWGIRPCPESRQRMGPVHPHVCGEYRCGDDMKKKWFGSSPRVWGIRVLVIVERARQAVHPHVCGEYANVFRCAGGNPRFIPTCVGNT